MQVFMTMVQPIVWLGLFGQAFNLQSLIPDVPGAEAQFSSLFAGAPDYFSFMSVGMLSVITLFACMFSGMSIVWDRRFGFLNKLKVAPIPRGIIPLSRVLSTVIRAMIQAGIVFVIALLFLYVPGLTGLGLRPDFGVLELVGMFLVLFLLSVGFASLFTTIALGVENQEVLFGVINLINLPIMFASAALFPTSAMPDWLRAVANFNPLTWASDALRQMAFNNPDPIWGLGTEILALALFAGALVGLSVWLSDRLLSNK